MSVLKIGKTGLTHEQLAYVEPMVTRPGRPRPGGGVMSVLSELQQQTAQPVGTGLVVLPRVNLLPPEIAERRALPPGPGRARRRACSPPSASSALLYLAAASSVTDAKTDLDTATAHGSAASGRDREVRRRHGGLRAGRRRRRRCSRRPWARRCATPSFLNDLSLTVPENVWVKNVTFAQARRRRRRRRLRPSRASAPSPSPASASSHDDVAVWLESLAKQKGYANPYFTSSTEALLGTRKTVDFTSTVTLTPAASRPLHRPGRRLTWTS